MLLVAYHLFVLPVFQSCLTFKLNSIYIPFVVCELGTQLHLHCVISEATMCTASWVSDSVLRGCIST